MCLIMGETAVMCRQTNVYKGEVRVWRKWGMWLAGETEKQNWTPIFCGLRLGLLRFWAGLHKYIQSLQLEITHCKPVKQNYILSLCLWWFHFFSIPPGNSPGSSSDTRWKPMFISKISKALFNKITSKIAGDVDNWNTKVQMVIKMDHEGFLCISISDSHLWTLSLSRCYDIWVAAERGRDPHASWRSSEKNQGCFETNR